MFVGFSQDEPSLLSGLRVQGRVIWALVLREVRTRFWKNRLGYLWALLEPIIHLALWMIFLTMKSTVRGSNRYYQMAFILTGLIPFLSTSNVARYMRKAISGNRPLLTFPSVRHIDLIVARWILESATMTVVAVILISGAVFLGIIDPPHNMPGLGVALAACFVLAFGWGIMNAVFSPMSLTYTRVEGILSRLLYFASGVVFPVDLAPPEYRQWLIISPFAHIVELFRSAYIPHHQSSFASLPYVLAWAFALTLIGFVAERLSQIQLEEI